VAGYNKDEGTFKYETDIKRANIVRKFREEFKNY
jgi:hypothetical protein